MTELEKPSIEQYEKQIDVDEFVLTESGREQYEIDLALYEEQQEEMNELRYKLRSVIDECIGKYKQTLPTSLIIDIYNDITQDVYDEL